MRPRKMLLYWLLLGVPTLLIGVAAVRLLLHERERLQDSGRRVVLERAARLADSVRALVGDVEQDLLTQLQALPATNRTATLCRWTQENPLVRNAFVWHPRAGVTCPVPPGATTEERAFLARYAALFDGRVPWDQPADEAVTPPAASPRLKARAEARQMAAFSQSQLPAAAAKPAPAAGWLPWFEGRQMHLLGWVATRDGGRFGVELESVALLARLPAVFEEARGGESVLALRDGEEQVLHRLGAREIPARRTPDIRVPLAPELPHWEIVAWLPGGGAADAARSFLPAALLLLATLLAAIVAGGLLLTRDSARQRREALAKTSFVSSVSHELKTPLTSIRLYAEMLREGRVRDPAKAAHYLDVIASESQRLTRLVNNVLDFSRLEQGRRRYDVTALDLIAVVRDVVAAQRGRLETDGLRVVSELPDGPCPVRADRDAVEQVLLNLLDNAAKYASAGGTVTVQVTAAPAAPTVRVLDRGAGIAAEHRARLFEQFYRVDTSITAARTGCGLGLSIARRLPLTDRELRLLQFFHQHPDEVLSRDQLINAVWGMTYYGTTRTLDQHIAQLRKKVEAHPDAPVTILTVHGVGYRYVPGSCGARDGKS